MPDVDVQALVDDLAADLGVAVSLVDLEERHIAHSAHDDAAVDEVRRAGILHRRLEPEMRSWFEQWGYRVATKPLRTPADKTLGILERWCVPARFRGTALGYLWLIESRKIEEEDLGPAVDAAEQIAALLYRRRLLTQVDNDLLRLILIPPAEAETASADILALGSYTHNGPVVVIVAGSSNGNEPTPSVLSDLTLAMQRAAEQVPSGGALAGMLWDLGVLLMPMRNIEDLGPARTFAERVQRIAAHVNPDLEVFVAIGGVTDLDRASHSYVEARRALRMLRAMPDLGPIAAWDDLGVFRALSLLPPEEAKNEVSDPRVRQLLADPGLAETAETFLDFAGDVQRTAAQLFVHRTTLYQRLDRIATLYRLDLRRSGDHRLITHLGLKLARITRS